MSKNIVLLADGTWNEGEGDNTNIHRLRILLENNDSQIVFYEQGVGSKSFNRMVGGVFGMGLSRDIRILYTRLIEHYEPGDQVYCLGFSRGAFTARSLCGFVKLVGQLNSTDEDDIESAYRYYQIHEPGERDNRFEEWLKPKSLREIPIRFLGVFDTVGALGVPFDIEDRPEDENDNRLEKWRNRAIGWLDRAGDRVRKPFKGFHDTELGNHIEVACHALALDERRGMFAPTLWTNQPDTACRIDVQGNKTSVPQVVEQIWFAGVHSDVGGGYGDLDQEQLLSNIPLHWMATKAIAAGIILKPGEIVALTDLTSGLTEAPQHDSLTDLWKTVHKAFKPGEILRPVGNRARVANPTGTVADEVVLTPESIHSSVDLRRGKSVDIYRDGEKSATVEYDPQNFESTLLA